jgi:hypothetical protein
MFESCRKSVLRKRICSIILLLMLGSSVLLAQEKKQSAGEDILKIDTDLVMVEVTATDKRGNYVRNLTADDFRMFIDGRERKIDFFNVTDEITLSRPLAVVFALDLSGSLKPSEIETLRTSALKFTELMKGESVFAAMALNSHQSRKKLSAHLPGWRTLAAQRAFTMRLTKRC